MTALPHFPHKFAAAANQLQQLADRPEFVFLKGVAQEIARYSRLLATDSKAAGPQEEGTAEVAAMMNLFALNLAIACAQLGEAGRESAQVAEEIRLLSEELRPYLPAQILASTPFSGSFLRKTLKTALSYLWQRKQK